MPDPPRDLPVGARLSEGDFFYFRPDPPPKSRPGKREGERKGLPLPSEIFAELFPEFFAERAFLPGRIRYSRLEDAEPADRSAVDLCREDPDGRFDSLVQHYFRVSARVRFASSSTSTVL